jgi:hypothetical protein
VSDPVVHVAARRYGEKQRCRRCRKVLHTAWKRQDGGYASFRPGHRILEYENRFGGFGGRALADVSHTKPVGDGVMATALRRSVECEARR